MPSALLGPVLREAQGGHGTCLYRQAPWARRSGSVGTGTPEGEPAFLCLLQSRPLWVTLCTKRNGVGPEGGAEATCSSRVTSSGKWLHTVANLKVNPAAQDIINQASFSPVTDLPALYLPRRDSCRSSLLLRVNSTLTLVPFLSSTPQNCQGHRKQGGSENSPQARGD